MSQLQKRVDSFATDFAASALSVHLCNYDSETSPAKPTNSEELHFERSFWNCELYCRLFQLQKVQRHDSRIRFKTNKKNIILFDRFATHENEQLACVHDYNFERISIPFNNVAEHDIQRGESWISCSGDEEDPDNFKKTRRHV